MYCPIDNGTHVPAGCTAVAMAQVLYYWQCRVEGTGQHSYQSDYGTEYADFENANYQWHAMSSTSSNQYNALLIYHCGVSTDMEYAPDGSNASVHKAAVALRNYFGFPDKTKKIIRWFHPFNWKSNLIGNLNKGLPIIYGADQFLATGHTWVVDGYDEDEKFHCNWGWSGLYDDYYELGDFCPGGQGCYNYNEVAIIEIDPVRTTGVETPTLSPKTFTYNPNGYTITIPEAEGATSYQWTCNHGTIQGSSTTATLYSDCNSTVSVRAYNSQCQIYSGYNSETMTINYGPITGPDPVCISNSTFTLTNYPSGSTVNWTKSSNLRYVNGQGSGNYTVKAYSSSTSGAGWVKATVTNSGCDPIITQKSFWVGVPDPTIDGNEYPECFMREWYFLEPDDKWGTYYWHTDYKLRVIGSPYGYKAQIEPLEEGNGQIFCDVTNACGTGYGRLVVYISCWGFKMSPNPADDYVEISIEESKLVENNIDEYEVRIYNGMNIMVSQIKTRKPTLRINTRQFINGVYFVYFIFNGKLQVKQLVISH